MALKRLIVLFPVLVILVTACSKQASTSVEIVAEVTSDGQNRPLITPSETPDPDAITVIIGTPLPFDDEQEPVGDDEITAETSIPDGTAQFGVFEPLGTATQTPISATSTPLPDVIMFTATPFPTQTPQGATDPVGLETSTPFIRATQPLVTPESPLAGDSAIHTPTTLPPADDETNLSDETSGDDDEITTIVTTPSVGTTRPTLIPPSHDNDTEPEATATEVPEACIHTVRSGDTVFKIALARNTTVAAIQAVNPSLNPNLISIGQRIILPNCNVTPTPEPANDATDTATTDDEGMETVHKVGSGDTLGGIARRYGVSVTALVNRNNITNPDRLSIGQEIIIPSSSNN